MPDPNRKVRLGLIGTGNIAQTAHMPGYTAIPDLCEIVAIADINEQALNTAGDKFGVKTRFTDYSKMLEMPEIDAVSVCTPNYVHCQPTLDAFAAGKHVLCEKPIAINAEQAKQMVAASHKAGKKFMIGYNTRFAPTNQLLKQYIADGELGEIYFSRAQALRRRGIPGWGVFIDKAKQGGGPLIDIGVHILDLTLWLMGHPKPVAASGATYAKFGKRSDIMGFLGQWDHEAFTVEDFAAGLIRFENGATISLESSFVANIPEDVFNSTLCGTEGGATTSPLRIIQEKRRGLNMFTPELVNPNINTHAAEMKHFVEAIRNDTPVLTPGEHGLMVAQIMDAIYASSEKGREVEIN